MYFLQTNTIVNDSFMATATTFSFILRFVKFLLEKRRAHVLLNYYFLVAS